MREHQNHQSFPVSSEIYAVAKFMTSAKFMTLTLSLILIYDSEILDESMRR